MKRKLLSITLALCLILSALSVGTIGSATASTGSSLAQYAQDTINGGAVLHCFNWSYSNIEANLASIKAAGYTAVQTSPVQAPKDYYSDNASQGDNWWKLYQPLDLSVADGYTWLGTKAQLKSMCDKAEEYGIKVIVDIVANHLANNGTDGGTYDYINSGVASDMKNRDYYHTNNRTISDYNDRYQLTQYHLGMPDLNTGNSYVQQKALSLLKECVDLGVDGFRFDTAKHIELPTDAASFASSFWPTVINGITEYNSDVFCYGEILGGAGTDISNYTTYMDITDSYTGDKSLYSADKGDCEELADYRYYMDAGDSDRVLWVESHDTYMGTTGSSGYKNTYNVSDASIIKAWAITGSRANSTSLFFARSASKMGSASTDTTWKSAAVAEINKFKNFFDGTSEYLSSDTNYNAAYNERGDSGVVISKLNGSGEVSLTAHTMKSGTYYDQITGNEFTVSNGKISGTVGSTGVAVVYNPGNSSETIPEQLTENSVLFTNTQNWSDVYLYAWNSEGSNANWPGVKLTEKTTGANGEEQYKAVFDTQFTSIIFNNGSEQTVDITYNDSIAGYYPTEKNSSGKWEVESWIAGQEPTAVPTTAEPATEAVEPTTTEAATTAINEQRVYFNPGNNWTVDNARFAVKVMGWKYYMEQWFELEEIGNGIYAADVSSGAAWASCKFARLDPKTSGFDNPWNVSAETGFTNGWLYTINDGEWDEATGVWSEYNSDATEAPTTAQSTTEAVEPITAEPATAETDPVENGYTDKDGKVIDLDETMTKQSDDTLLSGIGDTFKNLQLLGVQKKNDTSKNSVRFVSVINSEIVKDAADYGYIVAGAGLVDTARTIVESYKTSGEIPAKHMFSCRNSSNKISGNYGNKDADTKYKYVTFAVNNIGSNAVAAMFYVKDTNGKMYYAPYTNSSGTTYASCAANWASLK